MAGQAQISLDYIDIIYIGMLYYFHNVNSFYGKSIGYDRYETIPGNRC